ncbi:hypothetical protein KOR34_46250 [Posidoniimonas corsicana]|uniref:N-acetyltransferase domain-containing protein n=1 Tax=Posidoniimonas corsicana TaxID=1938618 RepID=A0A5C5UZH4_9BACT|nr:GNAT family N-acetyltransferase [Posidoniimonas corsicana]TWT31249.1 hypothetical protein KOR34_46250 [Posidoniimonas corsicana]
MPLTDHSIPLASLTAPDRQAIAELIARTWPKPDKDAAYRERQLQQLSAGYRGPAEQAPRAFVVRDGEQIIANAVIEPRTVGAAGGELTILGLGKVCSCPDRRGEGLGGRVVKAALGLVDRGVFPFALFQTSEAVRLFYERLGAVTIANRVVNSLGDDPNANPFADSVVMRYPSKEGWPKGPIDLRGPAY